MPQTRNPRIVIILQARMGSTRLPGKILKQVLNRPLLSYQLERLRRATKADAVLTATTTARQDDQVVRLCEQENTPVYRGSEEDVLGRYYQAAKSSHADIIVRVTGDCPLIDSTVVDQVIQYFLDRWPDCDYASNSLERTFPRGLDVEVFSFRALERAAKEAKLPEEREHVTPYFYGHPGLFKVGSVVQSSDLSHHRWTVDTPEDLDLITRVITALYPKKPAFSTEDVLELFKEHPDWLAINAHIKQKTL